LKLRSGLRKEGVPLSGTPSPRFDPSLAGKDFCYVTTMGRRTGRPHRIEIWFGMAEDSGAIYLLSGGRDRSDWVRNIRADGSVSVRIGGTTNEAIARVVEDPDEDALARRLLLDKYSAGYSGDLTNWARTALPIAIERC